LEVTTSQNRRTSLFWLQSRPLTVAARLLEGAGYRNYLWIKGVISPPDTVGASGQKIGRHYQPEQRNFVVLVTITTFGIRCSAAGGRRIPQLLVDQGCDFTTGHYESKRRKIGSHYQPEQRNFVVLATITTFDSRCSAAGGRRIPQLLVDQGCDFTTGHYGSKRAEDWKSRPATTRKLCCFG
jgi:hypothetical protein